MNYHVERYRNGSSVRWIGLSDTKAWMTTVNELTGLHETEHSDRTDYPEAYFSEYVNNSFKEGYAYEEVTNMRNPHRWVP